jgi:hypothetical protein
MKRLVSILLVLALYGSLSAQSSADSLVFQNFLRFAAKEKLEKKPAGDRVASVGRFFLGTPYVAYTLEAPGPERLQVNLHGLDCTTLVENALALSRLVVSGKPDFGTYEALLTAIRYRNGKLDGYPSRLHYASDWLVDNVQKGFLRYVPICGGMDTLYPNVNYMTTHPNAYAALKADTLLLPVIAAQEAKINRLNFMYLPKSRVTEKAPCIHNGDILAISTTFPGLDFAHLGIAVRQKGKIYLLHASSTGKKVLISETPLSAYLAGIKKHSGIVVVLPL